MIAVAVGTMETKYNNAAGRLLAILEEARLQKGQDNGRDNGHSQLRIDDSLGAKWFAGRGLGHSLSSRANWMSLALRFR
jgi:hypothetical protein